MHPKPKESKRLAQDLTLRQKHSSKEGSWLPTKYFYHCFIFTYVQICYQSIKSGNIPCPIASFQLPFRDQFEAFGCYMNSRTSVQVKDIRWAFQWKDKMISIRGQISSAQGFIIHPEMTVLPTQDLLSRWLSVFKNSFAYSKLHK